MLADLKLTPEYDGFLFLAEAARNPPILRPHRHVELELNLVVRGSITYVVDGRRGTFPHGTLLWIYPSQEHQLVDRTGDAQYYVAVFKPELIESACHRADYAGLKRREVDYEGLLHTRLEAESFDLIRRTMDSLMGSSIDPDVLNREAGFGVDSSFSFHHGDPDALNAGLRYLLLLAWRSHHLGALRGGAVALHPAVRKALHLLTTQEWDDDLAQLARRCSVSDAYLSRVFRQQIGVPLSRYRNSVRLGRFWERLQAPDQPTIAEAVYAAGFGSYAQFFKVFVDAYGRGPRECLQDRAGTDPRPPTAALRPAPKPSVRHQRSTTARLRR
jgi:methylphosphotriester-DNA--protein-cysteine methyltransferase